MPASAEKDFIEACNYFFTGATQVKQGEKPRIIFVFASPGAGKSTRIKPLLQKTFSAPAAMIEIDELKAFIPEGEKNNAKTADAWFNRMIGGAIDLKYNLVIFRQRNMLVPAQTRGILQKAQAEGYQTEVCIVALDKARSRLGMIHRYECALENHQKNPDAENVGNYPRKPDFLKHYIFFKALPVVAKMSELSGCVDKVEVYDRNGSRLAFLDKKSGLKSRATPLQALRQERSRSWIYLERNKFNRRCREASEKMKQRGAGVWERLKFRFLTETAQSRK